MRERGITLLLALAALFAFYALWLRPAPSLGDDADSARPTTSERRGNGYAAAFEWLQRSGVPVRSWRERYTALGAADITARGNLLILTLPGVEPFRNDEFAALDKWVRRGNTLLINAALLDQPGWAVGRESGVVTEVESITSIEFETKKAREARLDDTPLAERVRQADARDAKKDKSADEDSADESDELDEIRPFNPDLARPRKIELTTTGPHALLAGVKRLSLETDYGAREWSLRMPYDNFVLTLARTASGEGAVFEQRLGAGRILLVSGGTLFANRTLGNADNAQLLSNLVKVAVNPGGTVLFDDLRQGQSASYDPARFYKDSRLYTTIFILLGLWLVWVVGGTRLRAPAIESHDPSEAELVRSAGGLIARTVPSWNAALALFDRFFADAGDEKWQWLERHAAILPQELDQVKGWYADAHASRNVPLLELQRLLDQLERRLKT